MSIFYSSILFKSPPEYYLCPPDTSLQHGDFAFAATFLAQHLAAPPVSFDLASTGFNTSAPIPLKNPQNVPVSWSVSNSSFSLLNTGNTSATLFCDKSNQTGIVTASTTVTVPPATASALGVSGSFQIRQRKRMKSLDAMSIDGSFQQESPFATLGISNLPAGIPVSWSLSDNSNFRIVSSSANSAVIEALSYSKPTIVTATVTLQEKQISVQKYLTSPALSFSTPVLNCQDTEISLFPLLSNYESVEWSIAADDRYIKIAGSTNNSTVRVYGLQNTGTHSSGKLTVTAKVKGETISHKKEMKVAIPEILGLSVIKIWKKGDPSSPSIGENVVLVQAFTIPYNDKGVSYHWSSSRGFIRPCVTTTVADNLIGKDFSALIVSGSKTPGNQISVQEISPTLLQTLLAEVSGETEENINVEDVVVTRSATVSNSGKVDAVVLGISTKSASASSKSSLSANNALSATVQSDATGLSANSSLTTAQSPDKYVLLTPDNYQTPMDDPILLERPVIIPTDDPSYALLKYSGGDVTIRCNFISPCNEILTASVSISGARFSCSYTPGCHSITISTDDSDGNSGNNSGNNNSGQRGTPYTYYDHLTGQYVTIYPLDESAYKVNIYNDYGLVKQVDFDSSLERISIPMHGYPGGFYYVNVVDSQGNVVKRQTVQVQ